VTASCVLAMRSAGGFRCQGVGSISCRPRSVSWFGFRGDGQHGRAGRTLENGDVADPHTGDVNPDDPNENSEIREPKAIRSVSGADPG
jgi:hypothetical protein